MEKCRYCDKEHLMILTRFMNVERKQIDTIEGETA